MMRAMQLQHAKEVTKMRQETECILQQMSEKYQQCLHESREQEADLYKHRAQNIEDRSLTHIKVRISAIMSASRRLRLFLVMIIQSFTWSKVLLL